MKISRLVFCLFVVSLACMVVGAQAFAETVGYWRFEDGEEGAVAYTAVDVSGRGNDGEGINLMLDSFKMADDFEEALRYSADVPVSTIPLTGEQNKYSIFFDGFDDHFTMNAMENEFPDYAFTLEAYFKAAEDWKGAEGAILGIWPQVLHLDRFMIWVYNVDGRIYPAVAVGHPDVCWGILSHVESSEDFEVVKGFPGLEKGKWYHIAFTFEPKVAKLYIDGELIIEIVDAQAHGIVVDRFNLDPSVPLTIGRTTPGRAFRGWIDEVRISNTVLQPEEFLCASK